MSARKVALVTGASTGIGYEIAAGLGALGWTVGVGARGAERRETAVRTLRAAGIDAFGVALDVTDDASVERAAETLAQHTGALDVLVNNAGVDGGRPRDTSTVDLEAVRTAVETNVFGVIRVTNAMVPLLRKSVTARIVNMSSHAGSVTRQAGSDDALASDPLTAAYGPSKTFLNAVTVQYAKKLQDAHILVNVACPGYCATEFNDFRGYRTPAQGAAIAIRLATLPEDGPTGGYFDDAGTVPW